MPRLRLGARGQQVNTGMLLYKFAFLIGLKRTKIVASSTTQRTRYRCTDENGSTAFIKKQRHDVGGKTIKVNASLENSLVNYFCIDFQTNYFSLQMCILSYPTITGMRNTYVKMFGKKIAAGTVTSCP